MLIKALPMPKDLEVVGPPRPKERAVPPTSFLLNNPSCALSLDPRWFTLREISVSSSEVLEIEALCKQ